MNTEATVEEWEAGSERRGETETDAEYQVRMEANSQSREAMEARMAVSAWGADVLVAWCSFLRNRYDEVAEELVKEGHNAEVLLDFREAWISKVVNIVVDGAY